MTPRLRALLSFSKSNEEVTADKIARALAADYAYPMRLRDVVHHALAAYQELTAEARFEVRANIEAVLLSPASAMDGPLGTRSDQHSLTSFYEAMLRHMIGELSIARIDWCRDELTGIDVGRPSNVAERVSKAHAHWRQTGTRAD